MKIPFVLLVSFAAILAGCASPAPADAAPDPTPPVDDPTPDPAPPRSMPNRVHSIQRGEANVFDPERITIAAGDTVTWDVVGHGHHTVDFIDAVDAEGTKPGSDDIGPGDTFAFQFLEPGEYKYYCRYHSNKNSGMLGWVVVQPSGN